MKKSEAIKIIEQVLIDVSDDPAKEILEGLIKAGVLPPKRDYVEHYGWKSDHTWEKE